MPEEFDNSGVEVVDTISDNDDVDFNDEDIGEDNDSGSSGGSTSNQNKQDSAPKVVDSVSDNDKVDFSSEDSISESIDETNQSKQKTKNKADVQLTEVQGEDGFRLTEDQLTEKIRQGDTQELERAAKSSRSARIGSRINRAQNLRERRQKNNTNQRSSLPGVNQEDIVVGSSESVIDGASRRFFDPTRQVSDDLNVAGEAVVAGQDIIRESERFGERVEKDFPDQLNFLGSGPGGLIAGAEQAGRGNVAEGVETFLAPGNQNELEEKRAEQFREGVVAGPGTLAGFALGGAGAVGKATEQEIRKIQGQETEGPGIGGSIVGGGKRIAGRVSDDPGSFAAQEIGEETGEALARGAFTGGIGAFAVTPNIDPTVTVSTPESVQTTGRFATGNLGSRGRESAVITVPGQESGRAGVPREVVQQAEEQGITVQEAAFRNLDNQEGRVQDVFRVDTSGDQTSVTRGERIETPVSRREFLKERFGLKDAELTDFLNSQNSLLSAAGVGTAGLGLASGSPTITGAGASTALSGLSLRSPETTTTPETDTTPDAPNELFRETPGPDSGPFREEISFRSSRLTQTAEETVSDTQQGQGQAQDVGLGLDQQIINEQELEQDQEIDIDNILDTRGRTESTLDQETKQENILDPRLERRADTTNSTTPGFESEEENGDNSLFDLFSSEQARDIRRSVGADILNLEDRDLSEEEASNPLSLRAGRF